MFFDEISLNHDEDETTQPKDEAKPSSGHGRFHKRISFTRFTLKKKNNRNSPNSSNPVLDQYHEWMKVVFFHL